MLQPIAQIQHTYFKKSFELKNKLSKLKLPPNASLFTYAAISMSTNTDTEDCIASLTTFLKNQDNKLKFKYTDNALLAVIKIVMKNNRIRFGDFIAKQIKGIAMGMSPAPTIANLFAAIHKDKELLFLLQRFINDGLGI